MCRFGSEKLKKEFLAPSIAGEFVSCLGVSEVGSGSDVASKQLADQHCWLPAHGPQIPREPVIVLWEI